MWNLRVLSIAIKFILGGEINEKKKVILNWLNILRIFDMAITQAMCTSFKKELLEAVHNFKNSGGDTFKLALYTSSATLGATTTAFVTTGQASGTNYTSGGANLTRVDPTTGGTTGFTDFSDLTFTFSGQ